ncbi:sigma-70 family RNA polymerase sigma factor [Lacibacter sp. MH-610]|uniref:RNA polymerase sigma factor n=1 Tax=Lacibacter sp. MH-610 TaxID=3020883 RepID=UPI003891CE9B
MNFIREKEKQAMSDAELVALYHRDGDVQVLGTLYQRYMELIYGVCLKYLKDAEESKDAVMRIYEELVEKLRKHEVEHFKSWLYTLARNHCLMQLRRQKGKIPVEITEPVMQNSDLWHQEDVLQKEEQLSTMEDCMQQLIKEQKRCVELFYLQGKCYNEICEETGYDWNKVRSYIQNARRNLKLCMDSKLKNA